ncbi:MAG: radical SAM protein [Candidatus Alcyoniella australis]|nr:radical SAM protein [Candidatus Alcyoniella australis]
MDVPRAIFDDDVQQHDRLINIPGALAALESGLRDNPATSARPLLVRVHLQNFWKLPQLIEHAAKLCGLRLPQRPALRVEGLDELPTALEQHLDLLRNDLRGTALHLDDSDHVPRMVIDNLAQSCRARPEERTHLLRLLGVLADTVFIGPLTFHLDVSNLCNTDCVFCGLHSGLLRPGDQLLHGRRITPGWERARISRELFHELIQDIALCGAGEDLLFTGEGEPLTHPEFPTMVRAAKARGAHLTVFTNGLLLDQSLARLLVEQRVDLLYWSLSAASAQTFARVQPSQPAGAFERTVGQVRKLLELRRSSNAPGPRVVLAHVLVKQNVHECLRVFELARELGVEIVRYQLAHSCGPGFESNLIGPQELELAAEQIQRARELARDCGITVLSNIDAQLAAAGRSLGQGGSSDRWSTELISEAGCLAGWFFSRAFSDGSLSFCCHDKIVGDLTSERFCDIWRSQRLREIRRAARLFDPQHDNPELGAGPAGGPLIGPDCDTCGNYEIIARAMHDLTRLGLWPIVQRERAEARRFHRLNSDYS